MPRKPFSYAQQFAELKGATDPTVVKVSHPKPSQEAQAQVPGATRVLFTGIYVRHEQRPLVDIGPDTITKAQAQWKLTLTYIMRWMGFISMHLWVLCLCPLYLSWANLALGMLVWFFTGCVGICLSFHRQLTHRSFKTPKWLEYTLAFLGTHAFQGSPQEWVGNHRAHHLHTDTPLDLHSPYEGFYWAHFGWATDWTARAELPWVDQGNATDLTSQWFYRFMEATWWYQFVVRFALTQYFLVIEGVCWTMAWPLFYGWHVAFLVNSAGHLWGYAPYETGDLSKNNWWVNLLTLGECSHNTHHAFPFSARHGYEWYELDVSYALVKLFEALGLAWDIQLATEQHRAAKRKRPAGMQRVASATSGSSEDDTSTDGVDVDGAATVAPAGEKAKGL